jgi:anthranilate synthase component 1
VTPTVHWRSLDNFPDPLRLHHAAPDRFPFLLESAVPETGPRPATARYDLLLGDPARVLRAEADGRVLLDGEPQDADFLTRLETLRAEVAGEPPAGFPGPFWGGFFVYLAYEFAGQLEQLPPPKGPLPGPLAVAVEVEAGLIRDHHTGTASVFCTGERAAPRLDALADWAGRLPDNPWQAAEVALPVPREAPADGYLEGVRRARDYIHAGDVFQVNLARAWQGESADSPDPAAVYDRLRRANPAPFAGLARLPDGTAIVSSSPERLLRVRDGDAETRPIAGTRPRSASRDEDKALSEELQRHPKERAEHVMLIDLERNDLGRVCQPGSVEVDELMALETFAHVHHITSNVRGRLSSGKGPEDALRALFPGGTITGCPKVRCMEIIHELEPRPRGPYTGSMGYLCYDGTADLNILIRTLVLEQAGPGPGHLEFLTGAGIVADSVPERELDETRAKARGMLRALGADTP